ncbi:hypothetical protein FBU59_003782 [Linderina macrospora]|uniref:Uncharacterized protein n=1 Tax=Linderina macrospora TaxID=4868 RepID=A0ACC1J7H1_9FUNG|nr:hypothetical protein FBU59_003782 [Linderina macrospora]
MDGQFEWVAARDGSIPPRAIAGGVERDGRPLFIARAFFKGGMHPGKAAPHIENGGFAMGWGGREHNLNEYFVLCGNANAIQWVAVEGAVDANAPYRLVEAGKEADGEQLFVAKANFQNSQQLGKAGRHLRSGMSLGYGGREHNEMKYLVLAYI